MGKFTCILLGGFTGLLNGLLGAGGGMALVPLLKKQGLEDKVCHGSSVAVIFCISLITLYSYYSSGNLDITANLPYIPYSIAGAVVGSILLKKIPLPALRRIFGVMMLIFGVRLVV